MIEDKKSFTPKRPLKTKNKKKNVTIKGMGIRQNVTCLFFDLTLFGSKKFFLVESNFIGFKDAFSNTFHNSNPYKSY